MDTNRLIVEYPLIRKMMDAAEIFWLNSRAGEDAALPVGAADTEDAALPVGAADTEDAAARLERFAPYIKKKFPETEEAGGIIESPLREIPKMKSILEDEWGMDITGRLFLKCDNSLPISGSVKARGGIYEVLKFAEKIAYDRGMLTEKDDYSVLADEKCRKIFSEYSVAVGSTGNLGLSIGIMGAAIGFKVTVHMSMDASKWKKDLLRQKGVMVIEHKGDYEKAVAEGRKQAESDPMCHFVDDENSMDLFLGYSVAGRKIAAQFKKLQIPCDKEHPVFVHIPCGVGNAPGGITFGLKQEFGENVRVFFGEPTHAPCLTLGLLTGLHDGISVKDIGLDGRTAADGLAVSRPAGHVGRIMETLLDGCFTVKDKKLYHFLALLADSENILVEPSACAGFAGPRHVLSAEGYLIKNGLKARLKNASHIIWATGGDMVPKGESEAYYSMGK